MANEIIKTTFKIKRAQSATWTKVNPILSHGEPGCELDTHQLKIGDGVTDWINLPYVGIYEGPNQNVNLSDYVQKTDMAEYLSSYIKKTEIGSNTILGLVKGSIEQN